MTEERKNKTCAGCTVDTKWVLAGSVILNCFLIGVLAGPVFGPRGPMPPMQDFDRPPMDRPAPDERGEGKRPHEPLGLLGPVLRELSPQEAQKVQDIFTQEHKGFRANHETMKENMQNLAQILKAEKPDLHEMRKVLESIKTSSETLHQGMDQSFERLATELSLESRQKIAAFLEKNDRPLPPPPPEGMK